MYIHPIYLHPYRSRDIADQRGPKAAPCILEEVEMGIMMPMFPYLSQGPRFPEGVPTAIGSTDFIIIMHDDHIALFNVFTGHRTAKF